MRLNLAKTTADLGAWLVFEDESGQGLGRRRGVPEAAARRPAALAVSLTRASDSGSEWERPAVRTYGQMRPA
jgi:hypothetical protein